MRKKLGEKLKEAREKANLSQQEVADKLNVSRQTISKCELNINEPDLETLKELSWIYEVDINYLLGINIKTYAYFKKNSLNKIFGFINFVIVFITIFGSMIIIMKFLPETVAVIISTIFSSIYLVLLPLLYVFSIVPSILYEFYLRKKDFIINKLKD